MTIPRIYHINQNAYIPALDYKPATAKILPPLTFTVKYDMKIGFFLEEISSFELPNKLYGNIESRAKRILSTYQNRKGSTGVLLEGEKGSGKTLLAKLVCKIGNQLNMPVIVVNTPYSGQLFNEFIQNIDQEKIVLFDEFEKMYRPDKDDEDTGNVHSQDAFLTLLDGTLTTKTLYLFTVNDRWGLSTKLINRPGRIFYHFEYDGLEEDFIIEYCKDNLKDQSYIEDFKTIALCYEKFNFDMLQAIVEESNRFNEHPRNFLDIINAKPSGSYFHFECKIYDDKNNLIETYPKTMQLNVNYLNSEIGFSDNPEETSKSLTKEEKIARKKKYSEFIFNLKDSLIKNGIITVINDKKFRLELRRFKPRTELALLKDF